jgi:hypothetical protein
MGARLSKPQRLATTVPRPAGHRPVLRDSRFMESCDLQNWTSIGTMNLAGRPPFPLPFSRGEDPSHVYPLPRWGERKRLLAERRAGGRSGEFRFLESYMDRLDFPHDSKRHGLQRSLWTFRILWEYPGAQPSQPAQLFERFVKSLHGLQSRIGPIPGQDKFVLQVQHKLVPPLGVASW